MEEALNSQNSQVHKIQLNQELFKILLNSTLFQKGASLTVGRYQICNRSKGAM